MNGYANEDEVGVSVRKEKDETLLLDVPLFSIATRSLSAALAPFWRGVCALRWAAKRPLSAPLLPRCFPTWSSVPILKSMPYISIGEVLFLAPILMVLRMSINTSVWNKDVEDSGSVATFPLMVVFLTANKSNSLVTFVLGVPYERMITWHALWSLTAVATGSLHLYCAYYLGESDDRRRLTGIDGERRLGSGDGGDSTFGLNGPNQDLVKFAQDGETNFTGTMSLLAMASLVTLSLFTMLRRWAFELWYIPHIGGAAIAGYFAAVHGAGGVVLVLFWWAIDVATRYVLMAGILYPKKASIRKLPGDIVEISFPKPEKFEYEAGQYAMISIPGIGFSQFHPFTISSSPHEKVVTMHVKALGRWTRRLVKLAEKQNEVFFLMEGPYGRLMIELENKDRYNMMLVFCGGIGVTPMKSITNSLLHEYHTGERRVKQIRFIWSVRSVDLMRAMSDSDGRLPGDAILFDPKLTDDVLELIVYLTKGASSVDEEIDDVGVIKSGRPDIDQVFKDMKREALDAGETHVAVCVCGPSGLVDSCREASHRFSDGVCKGGVTFDFHNETFEF